MTESGDTGESVVGLIWMTFISESRVASDSVLCFVWMFNLSTWYLNFVAGSWGIFFKVGVAALYAADSALSVFSLEGRPYLIFYEHDIPQFLSDFDFFPSSFNSNFNPSKVWWREDTSVLSGSWYLKYFFKVKKIPSIQGLLQDVENLSIECLSKSTSIWCSVLECRVSLVESNIWWVGELSWILFLSKEAIVLLAFLIPSSVLLFHHLTRPSKHQ